MSVVNCKLLQCSCIGKNLSSLLGFLNRLLLNSRKPGEVVATEGSSFDICDTNLRMSVVNCKLLQCSCIGKNLSSLLGFLNRLLLNSRKPGEVVATEGSSFDICDTNLRMSVVNYKLLQCSCIGKNLSPLIGFLNRLLLNSRRPGEVVA